MNIAPQTNKNQKVLSAYRLLLRMQCNAVNSKLSVFRPLAWMQSKAIMKRTALRYERAAVRALQLLTQSMRHEQTVKQVALPINGGLR